MQMSELNISEIARRLGINHNAASKHLQVLEEEGILQQKVFGRIRMYRIKENSPKAKAIQNLIETWEPNLQ
jgi:predicted ArsR family transcriptional regulator